MTTSLGQFEPQQSAHTRILTKSFAVARTWSRRWFILHCVGPGLRDSVTASVVGAADIAAEEVGNDVGYAVSDASERP